MKTKKKAAAPSQPSSVVSNLSISIAVGKVLFSGDYHPDYHPGNIVRSISEVQEALSLTSGSSMHSSYMYVL